jgi:hypothetical protein
VVEKIWNFEVSGLFLWIFSRLGTLLELFFKNQGSNYEILDCGLILEKPRGFFTKLPRIIDFRIIFVRKKPWSGSTDHVRPQSTVDRPWTAAHSSSKLGLYALRSARVPVKGRERERGVRRIRFGRH